MRRFLAGLVVAVLALCTFAPLGMGAIYAQPDSLTYSVTEAWVKDAELISRAKNRSTQSTHPTHDAVKVSGYGVGFVDDRPTRFIELTYFDGPDVVLTRTQFAWDKAAIIDHQVRNLTAADLKAAQFDLKGRTAQHYIFLGIAAVLCGFSLWQLYRCLSVRGIAFGWLWALAILTGVAKVSFNWATGVSQFLPLSFQWPPVALSVTPLDGAILSLSLPVGAIVYAVLNIKPGRIRPIRFVV